MRTAKSQPRSEPTSALDDLFPLDITQGLVDESIGAGSDITFVVADGLVHNDPCAYVDELKKAVVWLETEVW